MSNTQLATTGAPMTFWKRPEGKVGKWFNFAVIAALGYFLFQYRTDITSFVQDLMHMIWVCVGLAITLYVVLDNKLRNLLSFVYMQIMRGLTGVFVEMDPVTAIKNKIQENWKKRDEMGVQLTSVKGGVNKIKSVMNANDEHIADYMEKAQYAQTQGDQSSVTRFTTKASSAKASNDRMRPQFERLSKVYDMGLFFYNNSKIVLEDQEEDLNMKIDEFEVMKSTGKLVNAMNAIFNGSKADDMIYNESYDYMMQSIANNAAELDVFVDSSKNIVDDINTNNGAMSAKGEKMLAEWEAQNNSFTSLNAGKQGVPIPISGKSTIALKSSTYNDLLEN